MIKPVSIKAKLKNLAVKEAKQFDYLLNLYIVERLLYRISISEYAEKFVLKGGLLLYTILEDKARVTKDIDMLARQLNNSLDNLERIFRIICSINVEDAIKFDLSTLRVERIKEDADYEGVRVKITAFLDKTKKVLQMDIGFGDIIVPKSIQMEYPSLLEMDKPIIQAYSIESVIAEKFQAMVYLAEANSRMKDFYDIYSLSKLYNFNGTILREAIESTFIHRDTTTPDTPTVFTKDFKKSIEKKQQWNAFKTRIDIKNELDYDDVIESIKVFLEPIYISIIHKENFIMIWDAKNYVWK
ncbi:MAG: nucleotidyl transferase AbiEii/AbiGii toxin family protein [Sedimentibacter sp.]